MKKVSPKLIALLVLVVFIGGWFMATYNGLVVARESVDTSWAQVETQYQRRFDLVPNLESIVKGAADFEQTTFTQIAEARTQWAQAPTQTEKVAALNRFDSALSRLMLVVENYPDLKATQAFRDFQAQLEGTENRIAVARKDYNEEVRRYNVKVKIFPRNMIAGWLGFDPAVFFQAAEEAAEAPAVNFE